MDRAVNMYWEMLLLKHSLLFWGENGLTKLFILMQMSGKASKYKEYFRSNYKEIVVWLWTAQKDLCLWYKSGSIEAEEYDETVVMLLYMAFIELFLN